MTNRILTLGLLIGMAIGVASCGPDRPILYTEYNIFGCAVEAEKIEGNRYNVTAWGNYKNGLIETERYALLKSAETALEAGMSRFRVIKTGGETRMACLYSGCQQIGQSVELEIEIAGELPDGADEAEWFEAQEVYDELVPLKRRGNVVPASTTEAETTEVE